MKPKLFLCLGLSIALSFFTSSKVSAQSQCCPLPDSLTVISVSDSNFCVRWYRGITPGCDTPYGAIVIYRPIGSNDWITKRIQYLSGQRYYTFCDSLTSCLRYQWKVRNVCISSGDTTLTDFVKGPNFDADCDSLSAQKLSASSKLKVYPNPVSNLINIQGNFTGSPKVTVLITDLQNNNKLVREVQVINGRLQASFDISLLGKGMYFITILNNKEIIKRHFIKE